MKGIIRFMAEFLSVRHSLQPRIGDCIVFAFVAARFRGKSDVPFSFQALRTATCAVPVTMTTPTAKIELMVRHVAHRRVSLNTSQWLVDLKRAKTRDNRLADALTTIYSRFSKGALAIGGIKMPAAESKEQLWFNNFFSNFLTLEVSLQVIGVVASRNSGRLEIHSIKLG